MSEEWEVLRQLWRITSYRDGCVWGTEDTGTQVWVPMGCHGSKERHELYVTLGPEWEDVPMSRKIRRKA